MSTPKEQRAERQQQLEIRMRHHLVSPGPEADPVAADAKGRMVTFVRNLVDHQRMVVGQFSDQIPADLVEELMEDLQHVAYQAEEWAEMVMREPIPVVEAAPVDTTQQLADVVGRSTSTEPQQVDTSQNLQAPPADTRRKKR